MAEHRPTPGPDRRIGSRTESSIPSGPDAQWHTIHGRNVHLYHSGRRFSQPHRNSTANLGREPAGPFHHHLQAITRWPVEPTVHAIDRRFRRPAALSVVHAAACRPDSPSIPLPGRSAAHPPLPETSAIAITVSDSALANFSDRFTLAVNLPSGPGVTISGLPATAAPAQQYTLQTANRFSLPGTHQRAGDSQLLSRYGTSRPDHSVFHRRHHRHF